jgi:hypothetical protein
VKNRREKSSDDTTLADVRGRFERDRGRNDNVESRMKLSFQRWAVSSGITYPRAAHRSPYVSKGSRVLIQVAFVRLTKLRSS